VIPASFDYLRAHSLEEALEQLGAHGEEAKALAGGHSLLPLMKLRLATPRVLVDIGRLAELSYVRQEGDSVAVGALTRHCELARSAVARAQAPLLSRVAAQVGDPQVRHRGTIGGSVAHGDPASDLPAALVALGATLVVAGPSGRRQVKAEGFFRGFLETELGPDELLVEVRVPAGAGQVSFQKFNLRAQDWAIVAVAAARRPDGRVGVGLANMGSTPLRAFAVEEALASGAAAGEAAALAAEGTEPASDLHADPEYRCHLARVLTRRALEEVGAG
jgi:carbon-monoxide dehydrogenase medium subunit